MTAAATATRATAAATETAAATAAERPEPEEDATVPDSPLRVAATVRAAVADEVTPRETGRLPPPP